MAVVILNFVVYIQVVNEQRQAYENATRTFYQIEQMIALARRKRCRRREI